MNEAPNPQPARSADARWLGDQLGGDPLAPITARFSCQQVNGRPELALQPNSRAMGSRDVSQVRKAWGGDRGGSTHGTINSQVDVEKPLEPAPALGFLAKPGFYSVL